ncbi:hypothetical protein [Microbacterium sp. che218]|uniref:hypothetical protein n=1 Tax=Microbacterium sp. che218 TaxID=3140649 RepID=UPI0033696ECA
MPVSEPLSQAQRDRIVALGREGVPRNRIAREVGVSVGSVSKYSKAAGVSFDRRKTRAATAAAKVDSEVRRQALGADLLTDLETARRELAAAEKPKTLRDHRDRAASLRELGQMFFTVSRASPVPDGSGEEMRQAVREFREALHEKFGDDNTYGQVESVEEAPDAEA